MVNLQVVPGSEDKIKLIDGLELSPYLETRVLLPYLEALWKSLCFHSESNVVGVRRSAFLEVTVFPGRNLCSSLGFPDSSAKGCSTWSTATTTECSR
ncbi:MAG: hypothetical protein P4M11_12100 [Candidatus Pacebacteria bacterium]|nr:hypothetical protein [Candidatus Paceibacterota bacterium]